MKWAVIAAISILLEGCASLPPILQRWADQDIATASLYREDSKTGETLSFYQYGQVGLVEVSPPANDAPPVPWRVRGAWLEIDAKNDASYQMRLRAVAWTKDQVIAEDPTGRRTVWRISRVVVVTGMVPQRPGLWMP
jgi:hypothetical protein